jgi:hypothetical protein
MSLSPTTGMNLAWVVKLSTSDSPEPWYLEIVKYDVFRFQLESENLECCSGRCRGANLVVNFFNSG